MADISHNSITPSSTSYASSVFPILPSETVALLSAIIERVPEQRGDWKPVLSSYHDVFKEIGKDGEADTEVYGLLLRLGMERGRDWRSKWETVKKAQQAADAQTNDRAHHHKRQEHNKHDLPQAYTTPKPKMQEKQARLTREALEQLQKTASPYKKLRNAVPPHHDETVGDDAKLLARPQPVVHFAEPAHADDSPYKLSSDTKEFMHAQALRFDRVIALGRVFDAWRDRMAILQRVDKHTALARNSLLKRRCLRFWADRLEDHLQLDSSAGKAYQSGLLRRCLNSWKAKADKKRKKEREAQVANAYRLIIERKNREMLEFVFKTWRQASLDSRCNRFRQGSLLKLGLGKWLEKAATLAEREQEAEYLHAHRENTRLQDMLLLWRQKASLLAREDAIQRHRNSQLASEVLHYWKEQAKDNGSAEVFYVQRILSHALLKWRTRLQKVRLLTTKSDALARAKDIDTLDHFFSIWRTNEHGRLFQQARQRRLVKAVLHKWKDRKDYVTTGLNGQADLFVQASDQRCLSTAFSRWRTSASTHSTALRISSSLSSRLIQQRIFKTWKEALATRKLDTRKAKVAQQFFLQRRAIRIWATGTRMKKAMQWEKSKESDIVGQFFDEWLSRTRESRAHAIMYKGVRAAIDQRIATNALKFWTDRVIAQRSAELEAEASRGHHLTKLAFSKWHTKLHIYAEDQSLVESFRDVKEEEDVKRYFRKWSGAARKKRVLKERYESWLREKRENLLEGCFERWYDRTRESQLVEEEHQVIGYRQHQLLKTSLARWQSRTLTLPAIRFDAHRLRHTFFAHWRSRLPEKAELNRADAFNQERLLRVTFSVWEEARRTRVSRRAANSRFRAFASPGIARQLPPSTGSPARPTPILRIQEASRRPAAPLTSTPVRRRVVNPASTSRRPDLRSLAYPDSERTPVTASRLRRELSSPSKDGLDTPTAGAAARLPVRYTPENVALPPSSSSGSSESHSHQDERGRTDRERDQHKKQKNKPEEFEEGVLREMRERLAQAGLGEGVKSRNVDITEKSSGRGRSKSVHRL